MSARRSTRDVEVGPVTLDRQGEVEIAKRIEEAEFDILAALFRAAPAVKMLLDQGAELKAEEMRLDDYVQVDVGVGGEGASKRLRLEVQDAGSGFRGIA